MHFHVILAALAVASRITAAAVERREPNDDTKTVVVTEVHTVFAYASAARERPVGQWDFPDNWGSPWKGYDSSKNHDSDHKDHKSTHKTKHKSSKQHKPTHHPSSSKHPSKHPEHKSTHADHQASKPKPHSSHKLHPSSSYHGGPSSQSTGYSEAVIYNHNVHRRNHSSPAIAWDGGLAQTANKIASTCIYEHNTKMDGGGYGQNIAAGIAPKGIGHVISDMFYNGEVNAFAGQYGKADPTGFEHWGHFSQVVWKKTTHVGCATHYCPNGLQNTGGNIKAYFTVCNYASPGNIADQYANNIGRPIGLPTVYG